MERYLTYVAPELAARGHQVSVVGGEPPAMRRALAGSGVHFAPGSTRSEALRAAAAAPRPDLLHVHMTEAEVLGLMSALPRRVPVVATMHFADGRGHSNATRLALRPLVRMLDAQIAISRFVAERAGPEMVVVPNGIPDPQPWPAAPPGARQPIVLMAQRLEPEKDTAVGLRAWAASGLAADGWALHLAGRGSLEAELGRMAARLAPDGSIQLLGHCDDLGARMAEASILLAPAPAEPFGFTVVEAMADALPVVAAAGGGHLETLAPASPDTFFAPGDAEAAGTRLRALAHDPAVRAEIGRAERRRFEVEYRIERHVDRLEVVYRQAAANAAQHPWPGLSRAAR